MIVTTRTFLTLLGAGPAYFRHLEWSLLRAPILVCADGGANAAVDFDLYPDAVIGDMDSITPVVRSKIDESKIFSIAEQDSTDFEKCLRSIEAPVILAHGFLGGRMDHAMAACNALVKHPDQICVLFGEQDLCFLAPLKLEMSLPNGTPFSLFPMGHISGNSFGLKYPINGLEMQPDGQIGISNEVIGTVRLEFDRRNMLIFIPVEYAEHVINSLVRMKKGDNDGFLLAPQR